jgi:hypothetical protein
MSLCETSTSPLSALCIAVDSPLRRVVKIGLILSLTLFHAGFTMANAAETAIARDAIEAADWMATALSSSGYKANFTLDSLKEIDRFVDEQAPDGRPKPGGLLSQQFGARVFALGAYIGETIRRQGEGQWEGNDSDPEAEINVAVRLKSGTTFWPMQRIMKRIKNGPEDGIYAYGFVMLRP